ncbi:MAG: 3-deoxy-8-phosphooctulonate synthase [Holosporales bacterium]
MHAIPLNNFSIANDKPFTLIAGPCAMESEQHAMDICGALVELTAKLNIPFIYKTSFDKANRSSASSPRGVGLDAALRVFTALKKRFDNVPIVTDVHEREHCAAAATVVDVLQIPAFLCRQTDLLLAAAATGKIVNVKKGQFLAPWDMVNIVKKLEEAGNRNIMLTERGVSFGYNTLVSDMRALPIMAKTGYPVIFDATHSVQQPGGNGTTSGGQREFVPVLARAALAIGVAGVFIETHQDPDKAPSDGPNMVKLKDLPALLETFIEFDTLAKKRPVVV